MQMPQKLIPITGNAGRLLIEVNSSATEATSTDISYQWEFNEVLARGDVEVSADCENDGTEYVEIRITKEGDRPLHRPIYLSLSFSPEEALAIGTAMVAAANEHLVDPRLR
jgi:hypothetical protein